MGVPCSWLVSVPYREIISENGSFRCREFSWTTSMPKWRSVSFVPGVTLNIEDSTSLDKAKSFRNFCRVVTETESNMKWFITFNVLEKRIIIPIQFKWNWRSLLWSPGVRPSLTSISISAINCYKLKWGTIDTRTKKGFHYHLFQPDHTGWQLTLGWTLGIVFLSSHHPQPTELWWLGIFAVTFHEAPLIWYIAPV